MQDLEFRQLIERLKLRSPIEQIVGERVGDLKLAGSVYKARCPFHEERTPSFTVDPRRGTWRCWGACAEGGDAISFIERFDGVDFEEALRTLAQSCGEELPENLFRGGAGGGGPKQDPRYDVLRRAVKLYASYLKGQGQRAIEYLQERGLRAETLERFQIGWAPREGSPLLAAATGSGVPRSLLLETGLVKESADGRAYDFFRGRFLVPIMDRLGRPVGFGGRILPEDAERDGRPQAKYVNTAETPLFHKSRLIYGLDLATHAIRKERHIVLVEGYTDVMAAHQEGLEYVTAVLGTSTTKDHAALVRRSGARRVTLVFDGDEAGRRAGHRALLGLLGIGLELRVAALPAGVDPCDLILGPEGKLRFQELLAGAADWFGWALGLIRGQGGPQLAAGVDGLFELLECLEKPVERASRVSEIALELDLPPEAVQAQWKDFEGRRRLQPREAPRELQAAAPVEKQESKEMPLEGDLRQAYECLLGALMLDNSLIPLYREMTLGCPPSDLRVLFGVILDLYDNSDDLMPIDSGRVMSALGDRPERYQVVRIEEQAGFAESPEILARDQEIWFERRRHDQAINSIANSTRDPQFPQGDGSSPLPTPTNSSTQVVDEAATLKKLHEELRRWRVPSAKDSSTAS